MKNKLWGKVKNVFGLLTRKSDPSQTRYVFVPTRHAGVRVDHDSALQFSAVFRAIAYISQSVAGLSWQVFRESGDHKKRIDHQISRLLNTRPNPEMSAFAFRETLLAWALSWGNGCAEIERDSSGRPVALWPVSPDRVTIKRNRETQLIEYEISNSFQGTSYLVPDNVFHLHGLGFDGLQGYSVISLAARSVGLSIAAEECGEDFFANGAITSGALKHPKLLSNDAKNRMRADLESLTKGHGKRWNIPIFEESMEWVPMSMPLRDAQMLETRKFQVTDIARWFGLPPHKLADLERSTFSNIEHQSIEVVNDALMPWVHRLEQEADYKLINSRERGVYTKLNVRSLLRGDDKARAEYYKIMREIGVYSTNDILRLEDMDPIGPVGDARIVQLNLTTLERVVSGESLKQNRTEEKPKDEPEEKIVQARASFLGLIEEAQNRIIRREKGQFDQIRHKIEDETLSFEGWVRNFFNQKHRTYIVEQLNPVADGILALLCPDTKRNGQLETTIANIVDLHVEQSIWYFSDLLAGASVLRTDQSSPESIFDKIVSCAALVRTQNENLV